MVAVTLTGQCIKGCSEPEPELGSRALACCHGSAGSLGLPALRCHLGADSLATWPQALGALLSAHVAPSAREN